MKVKNELMIALIKFLKHECDKNNNMEFLLPFIYRDFLNELKFPNGENLYNLSFFDKNIQVLDYELVIEFEYTYTGTKICDLRIYKNKNLKGQQTWIDNEICTDYGDLIWNLACFVYEVIAENSIKDRREDYFDIIYT